MRAPTVPPLTSRLFSDRFANSLKVTVKVVLCPARTALLPVMASVAVGATVSMSIKTLVAGLVLPARSVWVTLIFSLPCPMALRSAETNV